MLGTNWRQRITKALGSNLAKKFLGFILITAILGMSLSSCSSPSGTSSLPGIPKPSSRLVEVSPPAAIQALRKALEIYQPQVKILSPKQNEVLQDTSVSVRLQVNDLPLFQDEEWGLGPHLHFILDNQPYEAIYDAKQPILLEDLTPGTHTIRVFASRPWHESFKNEGAYAQATFHIFAKTSDNYPAEPQPLLTYSRPKGSYGAEPVMLDFYLVNAPLHLIARGDETDDILDWQVRCTINGESFTFDRWEPIYLKGLKPGRNWVQLELLNEKGEPYSNVFNNTVRLITYEPGGSDTLSRLTRGELTAAEVFKIVDQNYVPPLPPAPEPEPIPEEVPEVEAPEVETPELQSEELQESEAEEELDESAEVSVPTEPEATPDLEAPDIFEQLSPEEAPVELVVPETPAAIESLPSEAIVEDEPAQTEKAEEELIDAVEQQLEELKASLSEPTPTETETDVTDTSDLPDVITPAPTTPQPESSKENFGNRARGFFRRLAPRSEPKETPTQALPPVLDTPAAPSQAESETIPFPSSLPDAPSITDPMPEPSFQPESPANSGRYIPKASEQTPLPNTDALPATPKRYYPPINLTLPLP